MSIELGCQGNGKDLAWVRSPVGGFAVPCDNSHGNVGFAGIYDSGQDLSRDRIKAGQRVSVRITAPASDTWQLWITGGPAALA
jgi:hypothetical protein